MKRISLACLLMIFGATGTQAQMEPAVGQRGFDLVSGIVFYCGSATGFRWTIEACEKITADFKKRAAAAKMPFVEVDITADFSTKKLPTVDGFDQDKAVRALWYFVEDARHKGMVKGELSSRRVWEPTAKEIPNVAPGQRIAVPLLDPVGDVQSRGLVQQRQGVPRPHHGGLLHDRRTAPEIARTN